MTAAPEVAFSPEVFGLQAFGGASRCMVELMIALGAAGVDWRLWAGRHANRYIAEAKRDPGFAARTVDEPVARSPGRIGGLIANEGAFAARVAAERPKVVHRSFYPVIDRVGRGVPSIVTLHDMWNERAIAQSTLRERIAERGMPLETLRSRLTRRALARADRIVCISEFTRAEVAELWPEVADRCVVIHHGVRRLSEHSVAAARERPYFLFVGMRGGKKNFRLVLAALGRSPLLADFDLVCVGDGPFTPDEEAFAATLGVRRRLHHLRCDDDTLAGLYEGACALLYPSRYEGFGMPLLEAMAHDCPVIAAPLPPLPEVAGDAALYADAFDADAWRAQMERLAASTVERERLIALGQRRAAAFSWDADARAHAALYASMGA